MKNNIDYSLYFITDRDTLNPKYDFYKSIEEAILGGATVVQLREKELSTLEFYNCALKCKEICDKYEIPLIINDRIDIAIAVDASGVHMGQDDMPIEVVKKILGKEKIVGISASNLQEALEAEKSGADYLGIGAMYSTGTKKDANLTTFQELKKISENIEIPFVVIGGINKKTIPDFKGYDINGIAVVSAITGAENIRDASRDLKKIYYNTKSLDGIIFDLDGTLLDSIGMWDRLIDEFLENHGKKTTEDYRKQLWELSLEDAQTLTKKYYNLELSEEEIFKQWQEIGRKEYIENIKIKEGAKEILEKAKSFGKKLFVYTSLPKNCFQGCLEKNGIEKYFTQIYSVEDFNEKSKKAESLLEITEEHNLHPQKTLLIDDELNVSIEAKKVGMQFFLMKGDKYFPKENQLRYIDEIINGFDSEVLHEKAEV